MAIIVKHTDANRSYPVPLSAPRRSKYSTTNQSIFLQQIACHVSPLHSATPEHFTKSHTVHNRRLWT